MLVRSGQKSLVADVDHARIDLRQRGVVEPVLVHRVRLEVFEHDICAGCEIARRFGTRAFAQVDRDALLVAIEHRKETSAGAKQDAGTVAVDRFDLDHFRAHVGQYHAAGRPHHHVRELDDAQAA